MGIRRYETLDALRGLAAMAIVVFHLGQTRLEPDLVPHGYLAVDFFFVLSGFVVAHAYEAALRERLTWRAFFIRRVIRLYPLALLGAVMGLAVLLIKWRWVPGKVDPLPRVLASGVLNCLMLPMFFGGGTSRHELFPGNGPLWSLFFEMAVNMLWAWVGARMRTSALAAFVLASAVGLAVAASHFHTANIGFDIDTFVGGVARVCFGFPLGVILSRLHHCVLMPALRLGPLFLGLALSAVLACPWGTGVDVDIPWWDLVSVLLVLPIIVVLGVAQGTGGQLGKLLGALSYPVYVLHFPVLLVASGLHRTLLSDLNVHLLSALTVAVVLGCGVVALRCYDEPTRRLFSRITFRAQSNKYAL